MRKTILLILGLLTLTVTSFSQDSGALIDALIRKGVLTNQEGEDIRAELVKENNTIPAHAMAGGKSTDRLSVGARMQMQYANLNTENVGSTVKPVYTDQFFTRRMYLTFKAGMGDWGTVFTYDFAGGSYDDAIIQYKPNPDLSFDFGLRKVNVAYEERGSSGNLKSIERSGVTRYFVESNNGRRLGAASYRVGAFMEGKKDITNTYTFVYTAAVTNPQRDETFSGASSAGNAATNRKAVWGTLGLTGKLPENGSWIIGSGAGYLPDQGGTGNTNLGKRYDLSITSFFFDATYKKYSLLSEYLTAKVESTTNMTPYGYFVQPAYLITDTFEIVSRYEYINSDGRGVNLGDVIRSAPSSAVNMNTYSGYYIGGNWYIKGNDLKYQLGVLSGKTKNLTSEAKTVGVRSQLQLQF